MNTLLVKNLSSSQLIAPLPADQAQPLADEVLNNLTHMHVYPQSIVFINQAVFFLGRRNADKYLGIVSPNKSIGAQFEGQQESSAIDKLSLNTTIAPTSSQNAAQLRKIVPFLNARTIGLKKSAGCGDRLGLATPGHIRSIRKTPLFPIFAQQSVRENERTGRSPQTVLDDAMWGVFQEGWRDGFGADADHLKTTADIDTFVAADYTFYTIDPGDHVDNSAETSSYEILRQKVEVLPWDLLESTPADLKRALMGKPIDLKDFSLQITEEELMRAAVKYGQVITYATAIYRHLVERMNARPFELEVSVDETESVTTIAEHIYIASELKRLGVKWVSLAPRYVGTFEKGVDYIGDLTEFEKSFEQHISVAQALGPYKLSIHSGSDKFSIYPVAARLAGELIHLKTAGTSYLEALRTVAEFNPDLFRDILHYAIDCYPSDRASYHVSAEISQIADIRTLSDRELPDLLENFHAREVLHVTYGSVINHPHLRAPFFEALYRHEEAYCKILETHFDRHFNAFN
ncbi:MAG: tagaturonate epimerase family protein [Desulfobacterales bacterium]|jgi:hypothetical protein